VLSSSRIEKGEFNYDVYKIETEQGKSSWEFFVLPDYPDLENLNWANEQLTIAQIPHSRILKTTRDSSYFPNGFMISEYLEGENCEMLFMMIN